jgi:hypothetical protein
MKPIMLIALAALCFAQEPVWPSQMAQLKMLVGEWRVLGKGGKVEFQYDAAVGMVGAPRRMARTGGAG